MLAGYTVYTEFYLFQLDWHSRFVIQTNNDDFIHIPLLKYAYTIHVNSI